LEFDFGISEFLGSGISGSRDFQKSGILGILGLRWELRDCWISGELISEDQRVLDFGVGRSEVSGSDFWWSVFRELKMV